MPATMPAKKLSQHQHISHLLRFPSVVFLAPLARTFPIGQRARVERHVVGQGVTDIRDESLFSLVTGITEHVWRFSSASLTHDPLLPFSVPAQD